METQEHALEKRSKKGSEKSSKQICYDEKCKKVLSKKPILAKIMQACIPEFENYTMEEIMKCIEAEPKINADPDEIWEDIDGENTEDNFLKNAPIRYDVLFKAALPDNISEIAMFINIEAQNKSNPGYPLTKRAVYYSCRLVARQKNKKDGFKKSEYNKIKKAYSIWFCNDVPKDRAGSIIEYSITEKVLRGKWHERVENYDIFKVIMVYLEKDYNLSLTTDDKREELSNMIKVLFASDATSLDKEYYLTNKCGIIFNEELREEVDAMCDLSKGIKEEGRLEGKAEGKLEMALNIVKTYVEEQKITVLQAMDLLRIPNEFRAAIQEQLDSEKLEQ